MLTRPFETFGERPFLVTTFLSVLGEAFGEEETPFVLRTDIGEEIGLGSDRPILRFRGGLPPTTGDFWGGVRGGVFEATFVKDGVEEVETALLVAKGLLLEP